MCMIFIDYDPTSPVSNEIWEMIVHAVTQNWWSSDSFRFVLGKKVVFILEAVL